MQTIYITFLLIVSLIGFLVKIFDSYSTVKSIESRPIIYYNTFAPVFIGFLRMGLSYIPLLILFFLLDYYIPIIIILIRYVFGYIIDRYFMKKEIISEIVLSMRIHGHYEDFSEYDKESVEYIEAEKLATIIVKSNVMNNGEFVYEPEIHNRK